MHTHSTCTLAGLAAVLLLSLAVSNASARNISLNEQSFRAVWTPFSRIAAGRTIRCNVTLEASFHYRTFVKRLGALVGLVTRAIANSCNGGSATVLAASLPWHIAYGGFAGTLPDITLLLFNVISYSANLFPTGAPRACLARSTAANPVVLRANVGAGGRMTSITADETAQIPLEEFFCAFAGTASFSGTTSSVTHLGGGEIVVRLI
jgi:hypothetical protein